MDLENWRKEMGKAWPFTMLSHHKPLGLHAVLLPRMLAAHLVPTWLDIAGLAPMHLFLHFKIGGKPCWLQRSTASQL